MDPRHFEGPLAGQGDAPGFDVGAGPATVELRSRGARFELRFRGRFSPADLSAVKSIRGRRYDPDTRVWALPRTAESMGALRNSFGPRLVVRPEPPAGGALLSTLAADLRTALRAREQSPKTERAYLGWLRRFFAFHSGHLRTVDDVDADRARAFLEHLATDVRLAASSRNQAASALSYLFREVLGRDERLDVPRARGPKRMPMVLTHREVLRVLRELDGKYHLVAVLLYSAGLRLEECLQLRLKDVDFELRQILVRDGKGRKDRYVPLALRAADLVRARIQRVRELHQKDRAEGNGWAALPGALHRKDPDAGYDPGWQYLFPASTIVADPATGRTGRAPLHATAVQRQVKRAVRRSGIAKQASCHNFRHSFATEALRAGCDIRTLQHVMGHKDIRTTMVYLHVIEQTGFHVRSPFDRPDDLEELDPDPVGVPWNQRDRRWDAADEPARKGRGRGGSQGDDDAPRTEPPVD